MTGKNDSPDRSQQFLALSPVSERDSFILGAIRNSCESRFGLCAFHGSPLVSYSMPWVHEQPQKTSSTLMSKQDEICSDKQI